LNRDDPGMRNRELVFEMGGKTKEVTLRNAAEKETFSIDPPIVSDTVKMTIKSVYQSCKNGGALNVYGVKCKTEPNGATIGPDGHPATPDKGGGGGSIADKIADAKCTDKPKDNAPKDDPFAPPKEGDLIELRDTKI